VVGFLMDIGPSFGYFPNPSKTYLLVKPEYMEEARTMFDDTIR